MATVKPTRSQLAALRLLADGSGYRSERAFSNGSVFTAGGIISRVTVGVIVRNGWASWGAEESLKTPLRLTGTGRAHITDTTG